MSRILILALMLTLVVTAAVAQDEAPATGWQDVAITTTDGWVYDGVRIDLDPADPATIVVTKSDGATRRMPMADIRVIHDAAGRDITAQIIPPPPPPATGTYSEIGAAAPASAAASGSSSSFPRPFSAMLSAGVGFGHPFGDFYEGVQDRMSWHVQLRAPVSETTYLGVLYRNQQLFRGSVDVYDPDSDMVFPVETNLDLREILFLVGFLAKPNQKGNARAYFELGAGQGSYRAKATYGEASGSDSFNRVLLSGQLGVLVDLGRSGAGLDLGISMVAKIFSSESGEPNGFVGGVHGAFTWAFGRS